MHQRYTPPRPDPWAGLKPSHRLAHRAAALVGAAVAKAIYTTLRVRVHNPEMERDYMDAGRPVLLVTWHRGWLGGVMRMSRWHPAVMASLSRDGEVVARFEHLMGCHPIRGSSSRGGMAAQKAMVRFVKDTGGVATNVADGPQGPRYVAKAGMISLAQLTGAPLLPAAWSVDRAWTLRRSWDKTIIPKPFARYHALYGRVMHVPRRLTREQVEEHRQALEAELRRVQAEVDGLAGYDDPPLEV